MNSLLKNYKLKTFLIIFFGIVVSIGASYIYAGTYLDPAYPAVSGNTDTPINTGGNAQEIFGDVSLGPSGESGVISNLDVYGVAVANAGLIVNGPTSIIGDIEVSGKDASGIFYGLSNGATFAKKVTSVGATNTSWLASTDVYTPYNIETSKSINVGDGGIQVDFSSISGDPVPICLSNKNQIIKC